MNSEDQRDTFEDIQHVTYRLYRNRNKDPNPNWEETKLQPEANKGKETMGERETVAFNNLISALNDLVKGRKEMSLGLFGLVECVVSEPRDVEMSLGLFNIVWCEVYFIRIGE